MGRSTHPGNYNIPITDYVGIAGAVNADGSDPTGRARVRTLTNGHYAVQGMLFANGCVSIDHVQDGTTYTFIAGEQSGYFTDSSGAGRNDYRGGAQYGFSIGAYGTGVPSSPGDSWAGDIPSHNVTTLKFPIGHNRSGTAAADGNTSIRGNNVGVYSAHAGGTHMLKVDGSGTFVSSGGNVAVQRWYCIRDDHTALKERL